MRHYILKPIILFLSFYYVTILLSDILSSKCIATKNLLPIRYQLLSLTLSSRDFYIIHINLLVKKLLLFLGFLSMSLGPAFAQAQGETIESKQFKQRLRGQYLQNDTAQAIINLYGRRQAGGVSWAIASILSAVRIGTAYSGTTTYGGYSAGNSDGGNNMGAAFLIATPLMAYGVGKVLHYSNAHLEQTLTAYAAGQPLPRSLRRKLKPRFFAQPIVKYKEIKVKAAN